MQQRCGEIRRKTTFSTTQFHEKNITVIFTVQYRSLIGTLLLIQEVARCDKCTALEYGNF